MLGDKHNARAEQLAKALSSGSARGSFDGLMVAAPLIERLRRAYEPGDRAGADGRYRGPLSVGGVANTTAAQFMSQLDGSIVIIALPAIFPGHRSGPAVGGQHRLPVVDDHGVSPGPGRDRRQLRRLGDMFGRVRIYNLGFVVFTLSSILLSLCPFHRCGRAHGLSAGG